MRQIRLLGLISAFLVVLLVSGVLAQPPVAVTLFIDPDTLVLYVPGNQSVSLQDLSFEVAIDGNRLNYPLASYAAFATLYFDSIPTPICFRLQRDSSNRILQTECQHIMVLTQRVSDANVFWYDSVANITQTVLVMRGMTTNGICPAGQSRCPFTYIPPTFTPTALATWGVRATPTIEQAISRSAMTPEVQPPVLTLQVVATPEVQPPATTPEPRPPAETPEVVAPMILRVTPLGKRTSLWRP